MRCFVISMHEVLWSLHVFVWYFSHVLYSALIGHYVYSVLFLVNYIRGLKLNFKVYALLISLYSLFKIYKGRCFFNIKFCCIFHYIILGSHFHTCMFPFTQALLLLRITVTFLSLMPFFFFFSSSNLFPFPLSSLFISILSPSPFHITLKFLCLSKAYHYIWIFFSHYLYSLSISSHVSSHHPIFSFSISLSFLFISSICFHSHDPLLTLPIMLLSFFPFHHQLFALPTVPLSPFHSHQIPSFPFHHLHFSFPPPSLFLSHHSVVSLTMTLYVLPSFFLFCSPVSFPSHIYILFPPTWISFSRASDRLRWCGSA